jgi:hypothetical protein
MEANSQHDVPWSREYGFALSMVFGIALALTGGLILLCSLSRPPDGAGSLVVGAFTLFMGLLCPILGSIAYRASRAAIYGTRVWWTLYLLLFNVVGMQLLDHNSADIPVLLTLSSLLWAVYMYVLHRCSAPGWNVLRWVVRERQGGNRRAGGPELSTAARPGRTPGDAPVGQGRAGGGRSWRGPYDG